MLRKICFISRSNRYDSQRVFTLEFMAALQRAGVEVSHVDIGEGKFLSSEKIAWIHEQNPDLTVSFCNILLSKDGRFLWDFIEVPHLTILTDPLIWFIGTAQSRYSIIASVDRADIEMLQNMGSQRALFFPHAIDSSIFDKPIDQPRSYDISFIGTCFDYESIEEMWKEEWDPRHYQMAMDIIEMHKSGEKIYIPITALKLLKELELDQKEFNFTEFCYRVDNYIRGWDRIQMLKAIGKVHPLNIFGSNVLYYPMYRGWDYYLKDIKDIKLHGQLTFSEVIDAISKSRVTLNSSPFFYNGSHERILYSLALGASIATTHHDYLEEQFGHHQGVCYFPTAKWQEAIPEILLLLEDEKKRMEQLRLGREIVHQRHTWDNRAAELIDQFPDLYCQVFLGDNLSFHFHSPFNLYRT